MPFIEIVIPAFSPAQREAFAGEITDAFSRIAGFPKDILAVYMNYYQIGGDKITVAGKYIPLFSDKAYLHIAVFSPRLKKAAKREVIAEFTSIAERVFEGKCASPVIHLNEHAYDNIGVNGKMLSELYPELAERTFYYSTNDGKVEPE